jgi:hypothetical protein
MHCGRRVLAILLSTGAGAIVACEPAVRFDEHTAAAPECRAPRWCVDGTVADDSDSRPVRGAQVLIAATPCGALTDTAGYFMLACSAQPGSTLVVRRIGYTTLRREVLIVPGRHYSARIRLAPLAASEPIF